MVQLNIAEGETIIHVAGLKNSFGDQLVHDNLDLDVKRGEILGVVGGSGTGKSVLMRSIIGLQLPDEGEIEVFGEPMIGREEYEAKQVRKRWGVLFQGGALSRRSPSPRMSRSRSANIIRKSTPCCSTRSPPTRWR